MEAIAGMVLDFGFKIFKSRSDFNENLETLERNVKLLSDRAFDVKIDVQNRERSGKKKRKRQVDSWFDEVTKVEEGLHALKEEVASGKKNVGALEKMNGRVGELLEESKHFGMLVLDKYEPKECLLLAPQVHAEKSKQNLEVIWTWLHVENVSSIGIYGMGGVGKTTLAKHIHNRLVNEVRYHVRWVTVSQGFSIKGLQDDLAKIVNLDLSDEVDEQIRAAKLYRAFEKSKNIVIILDDVWDRLSLEKLGDPLGVEGCRLILTTRSREICQKMGCKKLLEVKKLNTDDAWELFKKSLGDETLLSPDIEPVAKSMARRCEGLPLGLVTLAASMRGVTDIREWRKAFKDFPDDMESDVFKVLQYSYDRLRDTNVQECFLYCALYPEDHGIDRKELIGRFIMEGLVKGDSRQEEFDQGHTILNKLVRACLLEAPNNEAVKMHDLVREMALRITKAKPKYMVRSGIGSQVLEERDWAFDLDKVSFIESEIKGIPEDMAPNCPTLSTLLLPNCTLRRIPESFFQYMNNLQVLDLSYNSKLMDLPSCISNLGSLRALLLGKCTELRSVPPLGKLKSLRVLDISGTGIKELPQGMENLVKLKYLDMGELPYLDLDELPKEILPKLSHLQYLILPNCIYARGEDLVGLELLHEFVGGFRDLRNFNKFIRSRNYEKDWWYDIYVEKADIAFTLELAFGDCKLIRVFVEDLTIEAGGGEAPTSVILPHCIDILYIIYFHGLSSCFLDEQTTLRGLTCEINSCDDIEWIINVPSGRNTATDPHCICFHSLTVCYLPNLVGLCKGKIASHTFSGLTELNIYDCDKMKKLFPRAILQDLKNLEKLNVSDCDEMEEIIAEEATDQDGSSQLGTSSDILILPKLKTLWLLDLPKLKRICEGKLICDSLEYMAFKHCSELKRLPFYAPTTNAHPFPALRIFYVGEKDWWETLEWEQSHLKTFFQPYVSY